jgi:hypothetical protein
MAECGVEVISPQQPDNAAAQPNAFRIAGRAVERMLRFGELVNLRRFLAGRWFVGGLGVVILRDGRSKENDDGKKKNKRCANSANSTEQTMFHG